MQLMILAWTTLLLGIQIITGPPQPGALSGRVDIKSRPPEQVASRYASTGSPAQQSMPVIPTIAFLNGPIAGAPAWAQPTQAIMVQKDLEFSPAFLIIPKGASVSFPNEDDEFHNVFSYSKAKRFDLGRYRKGEFKKVLFDKPGIIKVYCEVHPWMRAAILVLENPFYKVVAADGTFSMTGIPAGHYELVVWNIDAGSSRIQVDVAADKSPELQIQLTGRFETEAMEQKLNRRDLDKK